MLVVSRKINEEILIGENIVVRVARIRGGRIRLAVEAPPEVTIARGELRKGNGTPARRTRRHG